MRTKLHCIPLLLLCGCSTTFGKPGASNEDFHRDLALAKMNADSEIRNATIMPAQSGLENAARGLSIPMMRRRLISNYMKELGWTKRGAKSSEDRKLVVPVRNEEVDFLEWKRQIESSDNVELLKSYSPSMAVPRKLSFVEEQINKRNLLTESDWEQVRLRNIGVGMPLAVVFAILGEPVRSERTEGVAIYVFDNFTVRVRDDKVDSFESNRR
jgi:hypothetical protein